MTGVAILATVDLGALHAADGGQGSFASVDASPETLEALWNATDYRAFLRGWFEREKERRPALSYRQMGQKLAIDPSLLAKVFVGERHLATSRIQPLCDLVGLGGDQAEYFRHLVLHAKSKTAREAQACFARLQELRRVAPRPLSESQSGYWDSWVQVALRSLFTCGDWGDDWEAMGAALHPRQTARTVRDAVRRLEALGMAARDAHGHWRLLDPYIRDGAAPSPRALRSFHRQTLLLALEALEGLPPSERNLSAVTVSVPESGLPELVRMVGDFRSRIVTAVAAMGKPDRVATISVQLVPWSRTPGSGT